jgi:formate-dependent nitrite reductase membrane component NrfD
VVFLVAFMEEISWGQQVFKWSTPTAFESNTQNETNLHNFDFGIDLQQVFTAGILFMAVMVPLLQLWAPARSWIDRSGLPVVSLGVSAWAVATVIIANVAERMMEFEAHRGLREFMETMLALTALLAAIAALQQVVRRPATSLLGTDAAEGTA